MSAPVVIVGAGLAGTLAAVRLRTLGVSVRLLSLPGGATPLHGGGWALGRDALRTLHPYADPALDAAIDFTRAGLEPLALQEGSFELPDTEGTLRHCELAPTTHAAADAPGERLGVVDLLPLGHAFAAMQGRGTVIPVDWPPFPDVFGRSFAAIAMRLDTESQEPARLTEALKRGLRGRDVSTILLPPILGVQRAEEHRRALESALGVRVAESLDTSPSTPGLRLQAALDAWRRKVGVKVENVEVLGLSFAPLAVRTTGEPGGGSIPADAIILATGRYLAGGLRSHGRVAPALLDAAVTPAVPTNPLHDASLRGPWGSAVFAAGLPHDRAFRVAGLDGEPLHPRLFAVGDVLGGLDTVLAGCASGLCLLSAWVASQTISASYPGGAV